MDAPAWRADIPARRGEDAVPLRPNIAGFRLSVFASLVSGHAAADRVEAVLADAATRLAAADSSEVRPVLADMRKILIGELTRGAVQKEGSSLVNAVIALATTGQRPVWLSVPATAAGFIDFASRFPVAPSDLDGTAEPGPGMQMLVHWALLQRPLFGRSQGAWWSTYGFLTHDELGRLLTYHQRHPALGLHDETFAEAFFRRVREIHEAGLDYWFHCS